MRHLLQKLLSGRNNSRHSIKLFAAILFVSFLSPWGCNDSDSGNDIPESILNIFDKPLYDGATWALKAIDPETGEVIYDLNSDDFLFIGSVRKVFTIGEALDELGTDFLFRTPVHRQGSVGIDGVLDGDLILVAKGDLTMGGRRRSDDTMDVVNFDHNEADVFGNAELTTPDPLQGYRDIAGQVAAAGIMRVTGEVIIDDRLFEPYFFREQFDIKPIFVNDDVVDVIIDPGEPGGDALLDWRPMSAAFTVDSTLQTVGSGMVNTIELDPLLPQCFGTPDCKGNVSGEISTDAVPPLTNEFPIVQTFRITDPSSYARTIFIETLIEKGITIDAPIISKNPVDLLPEKNSYTSDSMLAEYVSLPFSQYGRLVLKPS